MKTVRGVYLNIFESDYFITYQGITFYFSSMACLKRFKNKVMDYVILETEKFISKYHININFDLYFMICFYKKIEKRGFRIYDENKKQYLSKNLGFINQLIQY